MNPEEIWRSKTDGEVIVAASTLDDYTEEGRRIILQEADRRGLNVAAVIQAQTAVASRPDSGTGRCDFCDTRLLFRETRAGSLRFCNEECRQSGLLLTVSNQVPELTVRQEVHAIFDGSCPRCGGPGPVDVHTSHRIWSALIVTSWANRVQLTCSPCGRRAKLRDTAFCLAFGWWGAPWGLVVTPVQIFRNLAGLYGDRDVFRPSSRLEKLVRLRLAATLAAPSTGDDSP